MKSTYTNSNGQTLYRLVLRCVVIEDGEVMEEIDIPLAYWADNKEAALEKAQAVGQAMARAYEANEQGTLFYNVENQR